MKIQSKRLTIRTFDESDITDQYIAWLNDPVITRFSSQRFYQHTSESCYSFFSQFINSYNKFYIIELKEDIQPIGTLTVYRDLNNGLADIGLLIGEKKLWGNGYGREAFTNILNYLLEDNSIRKVTAGTLAINSSMRKILEHSGMTLESIRYNHEIINDQPVNLLQFCIFNRNHYLNM